MTNLENPLPVNSGTLFQVGSITKTVTATAALRLAELGKLELDAPLRTYLPELRLADEGVARAVTLRHIFTHTGGWLGDCFDDPGPGDDALERIVLRLEYLPQLTPLGEVWSYCNAGFYLAGRAIEVVTGQTYEAAVSDLVLAPIGLRRSFYFAEDAITYRVAAGHRAVYDKAGTPEVARPWGLARAVNPAGGLVSSVDDMLTYARLHLSNGEARQSGPGVRLLQPATTTQMQAPLVEAANGEWMGLTWFISEIDGVRLLRHGGTTHGQTATLWLAPARGFGLVVLTNSDRGSELHQEAVRWALKHYLRLTPRDPEPRQLGEDEVAPYLGRYSAVLDDVELYRRAGELYLRKEPKGGFPVPGTPAPPAPPPVRAAFCGPDQITLLDEPMQGTRGEFLRDTGGRLVWLRIGGRIHRKA
ncbi:MAG: beta-lactamase family protein [Anaerolineales bacterium]|nr:beta-lactamase family protein [Anaerolineales bacterium]